MGVWLKTYLAEMVEDRLTKPSMEAVGIDWPAVENLLREHKRGRRDHALKIWSLLVLDAWRTSLI